MISLAIKIADNSLKKLQREFQQVDKKIVNAQVRACNRTAVGARTQVSKSVREKINVKASAVKDSTRIRKATQQTPEAFLDVWGFPLLMRSFPHRQTKEGVNVRVEKGKLARFYKRGFLATAKSDIKGAGRVLTYNPEAGEYKGIFIRQWILDNPEWKTPLTSKTLKSGKTKPFAKFPYKFRGPLLEPAGPAIPDIVSGNTWEKIEKYTNDRLERELDHEIKRALETT